MTNPLQDKDKQWRNRRANGARPIFDPGMAPLGVDDEAGGTAPGRYPDSPVSGDPEPLPLSPDSGGHGIRLPPWLWYAAAAGVVALFILAGALSLLER